MKKYLITICLLLIGLGSYSQNLSEVRKIPVKGFYTNPLVSPTGNYTLLTGLNFNGVYLLNMKTKKTTQISRVSGSGYGYSWSNDGKTIFFKEKKENDYVANSEVKSYTIKTKLIKKHLDINHNYLPSFNGQEKGTGIVIYTNLSTLKIEAKDLKTSKSWVVTNDEGQFYNAILSNDKKKVAVHNGSDIYVYNTDGSGLITKIGTGIATSWSKDDKYLIGFLDESKDGHEISNSELYLFNAATSKTTKITNSEEVFEMFPSFYDGDKIIYADDKTGQIFTSRIKL
ncbi:hypothetical protein [Flavobacterium sp.]|uniref:hypothetical protein n=1 Tax=Flavobacterium sp. TaxID=239 RepID=UPI002B4B0771|nr:hypothetical protein [Flavobacterium sp.]HLF51797.1 hypothetical protein [Flavobacterium sp.]